MNSSLALFGGETSTPEFESVHLRLVDLARSTRSLSYSHKIRVVYLTTCASQDGAERVDYLRERATQVLGSIGLEVLTPPVIDHQTANDAKYAKQVSEADWIYFSGGKPHVGMRILAGSRVLDAILAAWDRGVLLSGSSAGAMLLCSHSIVITPEMDTEVGKMIRKGEGISTWKIPMPPLEKCLGLVPRSMCWPHMNVIFSPEWVRSFLPEGYRFIGVDEQTAAVRDTKGKWQVWGEGSVVVGTSEALQKYTAGDTLNLKD